MRGIYRIQKVLSRIAPTALILLYHRVSVNASDPQLLCISPDHFSDHLKILSQLYHPLKLKDLHKRLKMNTWLDRSVVITFDDGYADNFQAAQSILKGYKLPATFFITSGMVDSNREFWWDELERIFLSNHDLPDCLELSINYQQLRWNFEHDPVESRQKWNVAENMVSSPHQQAYSCLVNILHNLNYIEREAALDMLADWAHIDRNYGRKENLAVTSEIIRSIASDDLIEIGAHTLNHLALSALPIDEQRKEILEGKSMLEQIIGHEVDSFSYPFGTRDDYSRDTVKLVKEAGFRYACSNFQGHPSFLSDPYQLPRYVVRDWDGESFMQKLESWFHE